MESIKLYQLMVMWGFGLCLLSIALCTFRSLWFAPIAAVCFAVFITGVIKRDGAISETLAELGCTYVGSGERGPSHTTPTRYYKCPDGVIRSK